MTAVGKFYTNYGKNICFKLLNCIKINLKILGDAKYTDCPRTSRVQMSILKQELQISIQISSPQHILAKDPRLHTSKIQLTQQLEA